MGLLDRHTRPISQVGDVAFVGPPGAEPPTLEDLRVDPDWELLHPAVPDAPAADLD